MGEKNPEATTETLRSAIVAILTSMSRFSTSSVTSFTESYSEINNQTNFTG